MDRGYWISWSRRAERWCLKYGAELQEPTLVEIFHQQKDFGVEPLACRRIPGT